MKLLEAQSWNPGCVVLQTPRLCKPFSRDEIWVGRWRKRGAPPLWLSCWPHRALPLVPRLAKLTTLLRCLVNGLDAATLVMANIALPTIATALNFDDGEVQWVLTSFALTVRHGRTGIRLVIECRACVQ